MTMTPTPATRTFEKVAGTCPACNWINTLFVGSGGYITCSRADCPDPGAASDLLDVDSVYLLALSERIRAHAKHKASGGSMEDRDWNDAMWLPVLTEEVGEVARVLCDQVVGLPHERDADHVRHRLREELVQVAAMAIAWVDAIHRERA